MKELITTAILAAIGGAGGGDLVSKTVTENKTYRASDDGHDGYSQVIVQVPLGSDTFTANGDYWYDPSKAMTKGGWWHITVSVPAPPSTSGYIFPQGTDPNPIPVDVYENLVDMSTNIGIKANIYYNREGRSGCWFGYTQNGTFVQLNGYEGDTSIVKFHDPVISVTDPTTGAWSASVTIERTGAGPITLNWSGTAGALIGYGASGHNMQAVNNS